MVAASLHLSPGPAEGAAAWVLEKQGTAPKLVSCTGEHQPGEETTL